MKRMNLSMNKVFSIHKVREQLGVLGIASIVIIVASAVFAGAVLEPLRAKNESLESDVNRLARRASVPQQGVSVGDKLASLYAFLQRNEAPTDWLAKLHGIGTATGVEIQSATYRTPQAAGKVERYEIVLPVAGTYGQIRDFLKRSLAEIPVLSLDQLSIKRENRNDGVVNAELRLTLHLVKP